MPNKNEKKDTHERFKKIVNDLSNLIIDESWDRVNELHSDIKEAFDNLKTCVANANDMLNKTEKSDKPKDEK